MALHIFWNVHRDVFLAFRGVGERPRAVLTSAIYRDLSWQGLRSQEQPRDYFLTQLFFIYSIVKINVTYLGDVSYFIRAQARRILGFFIFKVCPF